jgi:gamma-glutamylaminecyclotransferase
VTTHRLFVYGSLKRGFRHHHVLGAAPFEGDARTAPGFSLVLQGEYPALVCSGDECVHGELYRVTDELLAELDRFEGCPDLYRSELISLDDGTSALSYVIPPARAQALPKIPQGRWVESDPPQPPTP